MHQRQCVKMWQKTLNHNNIQTKPPRKKCPGLNEHFETHLNPDCTKIKMLAEIEQIQIIKKSAPKYKQYLT